MTGGEIKPFTLIICNFNNWKPTEEQWKSSLDFINDLEETNRIMRFIKPQQGSNGKMELLKGKDNPNAKASLIGRRLMMDVVHKMLNIPYKSIQFQRTSSNKPYLSDKSKAYPKFNFNVSHDGDLTAIFASYRIPIGIDIMKVKSFSTESSINEFFDSVDTCFTNNEWRNIRSFPLIHDRIKQFYMHWCLKESFVKTTGTGLEMDLQRLEFEIEKDHKSAKVCIDGKLSDDYQFQLLEIPSQNKYADDSSTHIISLCYNTKDRSLVSDHSSILSSMEILEKNDIDR